MYLYTESETQRRARELHFEYTCGRSESNKHRFDDLSLGRGVIWSSLIRGWRDRRLVIPGFLRSIVVYLKLDSW